MSTENVTWAPHFCVLVLFWVPNILQCRESKLWGSTLTSKKEKKEHLGWKRWWFKLCLLFCISQSRIFIQCPILFWILLYPKNCPNRDAWDWVPSKNLWCSFEDQAIIVMCTPAYVFASTHTSGTCRILTFVTTRGHYTTSNTLASYSFVSELDAFIQY